MYVAPQLRNVSLLRRTMQYNHMAVHTRHMTQNRLTLLCQFNKLTDITFENRSSCVPLTLISKRTWSAMARAAGHAKCLPQLSEYEFTEVKHDFSTPSGGW